MRKPVQAVTLTLPPPISTNAIWRAFVRPGTRHAVNIKSEKYRQWIKQAGYELELQNPGRVEGAFGIRIAVPDKCRTDTDNCVKAFLDLLETHGVIVNDGPRNFVRLEVWRSKEKRTMVQVISTKAIDDADA